MIKVTFKNIVYQCVGLRSGARRFNYLPANELTLVSIALV